MRRVALFFRRIGFFQGVLYVLFLAYMAWEYSRLWTIPGGPVFVLSVLSVGVGVGSALAPLMYRYYSLSRKIVSAMGLMLLLVLMVVFRMPINLPRLGYWAVHAAVWLQITTNFWIGTYQPRILLADGRDLLRMLEEMKNEDSDKESTPAARRPPANDDQDDDNWYRRS